MLTKSIESIESISIEIQINIFKTLSTEMLQNSKGSGKLLTFALFVQKS